MRTVHPDPLRPARVDEHAVTLLLDAPPREVIAREAPTPILQAWLDVRWAVRDA